MSLKLKFILRFGGLFAFATFAGALARSTFLRHEKITLAYIVMRLLSGSLAGIFWGSFMWDWRQKQMKNFR